MPKLEYLAKGHDIWWFLASLSSCCQALSISKASQTRKQVVTVVANTGLALPGARPCAKLYTSNCDIKSLRQPSQVSKITILTLQIKPEAHKVC